MTLVILATERRGPLQHWRSRRYIRNLLGPGSKCRIGDDQGYGGPGLALNDFWRETDRPYSNFQKSSWSSPRRA